MQSLEVISVNLWQILISLLNLLILFLLFKKYLFAPVNKMLDKRNAEISEKYKAADEAKRVAEEDKKLWDDKISTLETEADEMIQTAKKSAKQHREKILAKANDRAEDIIRQAEARAELEIKKAEDGIKKEIVEVSTAIAGKLLEREISDEDHRSLIDSFIEKMGE